jgi:hypothetical protein
LENIAEEREREREYGNSVKDDDKLVIFTWKEIHLADH